MNKLYIISILLLWTVVLSAQNNFKEMYESLSQNDRFSNMLNIRTYQQENPDHAIAYFLLGEISDSYLRETDPTRQFVAIETNYNQLKTYYGLAAAKLTERQAREDREYYSNVEKITDKKKISYPDISNEIKNRLLSAEVYFQQAKTVHESYLNCIGQYNRCLFSFREIVSTFPYYKDLYLLASPDLIMRISDLSESYRLARTNFQIYREACKELPHLLKVPVLVEVPIITYRLEGLIETNFNADIVRFWNFGQWADDFQKVMNEDVQTIRSQLVETDKKLDQQIKKLISGTEYSDEMELFKPDERFQFLIGKYDPNALCNVLLNYKASKIDFLSRMRLLINDPAKAPAFYLSNRLRYFRDLALELESLNRAAESLKQQVSLEDIDKHFAFFETGYRGMDGLKRWCDVEKFSNRTNFNTNLGHLDHFLKFNNSKNKISSPTKSWNKKIFNTGILTVNNTATFADTLIVLNSAAVDTSTLILSGLEFFADSSSIPFLAWSDTSNQVRWLVHPLEKKKSREHIIAMPAALKVLTDSCSILLLNEVRNMEGELFQRNLLYRYNGAGKLLQSGIIDTTGYPEYFSYDEIADDYLLITQGATIPDSIRKDPPLTLSLIDNQLNTKWTLKGNLNGIVTGVIPINSNFLVVGYGKRMSLAGIEKANLSGQYVLGFSILINRNGQIEQLTRYEVPGKDLTLTSALKVSNNHLMLFGSLKDSSPPDFLYLLVDETGMLRFKNIENLKTEAILDTIVEPVIPSH